MVFNEYVSSLCWKMIFFRVPLWTLVSSKIDSAPESACQWTQMNLDELRQKDRKAERQKDRPSDHLTTWRNELNRPQIDPSPPPMNEDELGWGGGRTGQVGATTTCSQNKHVGEFLYFKLTKLPLQVKSRPIKDVTKYVLNTDVQFKN